MRFNFCSGVSLALVTGLACGDSNDGAADSADVGGETGGDVVSDVEMGTDSTLEAGECEPEWTDRTERFSETRTLNELFEDIGGPLGFPLGGVRVWQVSGCDLTTEAAQNTAYEAFDRDVYEAYFRSPAAGSDVTRLGRTDMFVEASDALHDAVVERVEDGLWQPSEPALQRYYDDLFETDMATFTDPVRANPDDFVEYGVIGMDMMVCETWYLAIEIATGMVRSMQTIEECS